MIIRRNKNEKDGIWSIGVYSDSYSCGGIQQYSSKPDIVGQQAKTVEQVNLYLPFQSERGFSIFVPQNSTKLEK